jgi:hypothetical protein
LPRLRKKKYLEFNLALVAILFVCITFAAAIVSERSVTTVLSGPDGLDVASKTIELDNNQNALVFFAEDSVGLLEHRSGSWTKNELLGPLNDSEYQCVAVGDVFPSDSGDEIVVVTSEGEVIVLSRSNGIWSSTIIYERLGWGFSRLAVGDVDIEHVGNGIITAGKARNQSSTNYEEIGFVAVLSRTETNEWNATRIEVPYPVVSLAIGDFDEQHTGDECLVGQDSGHITEMVFLGANQWSVEPVLKLESYRPGLAVGDVDPRHMGDEIVVIEGDRVSLVRRDDNGNWTLSLIGKDPRGRSLEAVTVFEADVNHNAAKIVAGSVSGGLFDIHFDGETWRREVLVNPETSDNYFEYFKTVVMSNVDSGHDGNEIITSSSRDSITVAYKRTTVDRFSVVLPWAPIGLIIIGGINLPFIPYELRQRGIRKLKARGYTTQCPICGRCLKPEEADLHINLHMSKERK